MLVELGCHAVGTKMKQRNDTMRKIDGERRKRERGKGTERMAQKLGENERKRAELCGNGEKR